MWTVVFILTVGPKTQTDTGVHNSIFSLLIQIGEQEGVKNEFLAAFLFFVLVELGVGGGKRGIVHWLQQK